MCFKIEEKRLVSPKTYNHDGYYFDISLIRDSHLLHFTTLFWTRVFYRLLRLLALRFLPEIILMEDRRAFFFPSTFNLI